MLNVDTVLFAVLGIGMALTAHRFVNKFKYIKHVSYIVWIILFIINLFFKDKLFYQIAMLLSTSMATWGLKEYFEERKFKNKKQE